MKKETLESLLQGKIFCIPDYQRGYAWEKKQWKDFVTDIDALIEEDVKNHYTGTVVVFQKPEKPIEKYGLDRLEVLDVVDGQQRLTTSTLYLSIIIKKLISLGQIDYGQKVSTYLHSGEKPRLKLNNGTDDYFFDLISKGFSNTVTSNTHQERLQSAYIYLNTHLEEQCAIKKGKKIEYLTDLYDAIVRKLNFTFYSIEDESEIGMTFELMNSRGQSLSILELLKNYLERVREF